MSFERVSKKVLGPFVHHRVVKLVIEKTGKVLNAAASEAFNKENKFTANIKPQPRDPRNKYFQIETWEMRKQSCCKKSYTFEEDCLVLENSNILAKAPITNVMNKNNKEMLRT